MPDEEIRAVSHNLVEALRFFGRARENAEVRDLPGLTLIFCGLNYAAFNAALLIAPLHNDSAELMRLIKLAASQFDAQRLRWTFWLCNDFMSRSLSRQAPHIFSRYHLRPLTQAPGMYTEHLRPAVRALPELEIRPVSDPQTRATFAEIMSLAFEIPHSIAAAVYASERAWSGSLRGYIGYLQGKPVTTAASTVTGDVIGLYSVATLPQHRRMGLAEAIMRQVIEQAYRSQGVQRTVLQSTSAGLALYEQMGYRTLTDFDVYIAD